MAIYQITPSNSVLNTLPYGYAFGDETPEADTLIVDPAAYLRVEGTSATAAGLGDDGGPWTVVVNGLIHSELGTGMSYSSNVSVTIGQAGVIYGGHTACESVGTEASFVNAGSIYGGNIGIDASNDYEHVVRNSGLIHGGSYSILGSSRADSITNSGTLRGDLSLGRGLNTVTNFGIIDGNISAGADRDVVKNPSIITGVVDLGGGDDSFTGGYDTDIVVDGAGADLVKLGNGDDFYFGIGSFNQADDGADSIDGGSGLDSYNATSAIDAVFINLDKKAHDFSPFMPGVGVVAGSTATGIGLSTDTIRNFEAVLGGAGNDIIYGSSAANVLSGSGGFDTLAGFAGNDVLNGGAGGDALYGGAGRDVLTGGEGADTFQFAAVSETGLTITTSDTIVDFESGIDRIDLSAIDAIAKGGTANDAFTFIDSQAFTGTAGQLRAYTDMGRQIVEGDVNGDGTADFAIEVLNNAFTNTLTAADFVL